MAIFTVRPSRGTVVFFALLIVGLLLRIAWGKHEQQLVATDGPPAHSARRLLRCVLGRDAQRLLGPREAAGDRGATWALRMSDRLERLVTANHGRDGWPGRCAPIAERLAARLVARPESHAAGLHARAVARALREADANRRVAIELVVRGELGGSLAALTYMVSGLSAGAENGWTSALPPAATDLWPAREATVPRGVPVGQALEYATFAGPDTVLYQSLGDRSLHAATFGDDERVREDRVLGRGAPVRGAFRGGAVLVAEDDGDAVYLPGGEPAALVPLPPGVRDGREAAHDWHVLLTPGYLWLLTDDDGTLRVRAVPRASPVQWDAPVASIGGPDVMVGGVLAPAAAGGDAVTVVAVRRGGAGVWVEQHVVSAPPGASEPRQPARRAPPAPPAEVLVQEWPAFDPRLTTCAAGAVRYILVRSADAFSVVRVEAGRGTRLELSYTVAGPPSGGRLDLSCDARRALLYADLVGRPGTLVQFDFEQPDPAVLLPPQLGPNTRVVGGVLVPDGVVALVASRTVRAFRTRDRGASWDGGELVAAVSDGERFEVAAVAAQGDRVAVLAEMQVGARLLVGRLGSRDGVRFGE